VPNQIVHSCQFVYMRSLLDINLLYDMPGSGMFWLINFAIFFFL